jgi:hypothetical protein
MAIQNNFPNIRPTLNLNFALSKRVDPRITFVRSTTATYFDQDGILQTAAANQGRITFDPSTLDCQGLLIEEQRTNSIRNNTMQGAVAGTPGTDPTNWLISTASGNLTSRQIVGIGTENGIAYIDVRFVASGAFTASIYADSSTGVPAANGQTWTTSFFIKLVGGSLANVTIQTSIVENDAGGNFLAGADSANIVPTSAALATQRFIQTRTNTNALTAFEWSRVKVAFTGAGDITLRIGLPQLEQGAFATSVIPTTTTALTRNADAASMTGTNFSSWYNASEGTLYGEYAVNGYAPSGAFPATVSISDNTSNNRIVINSTNTGANLYSYSEIVDSGVMQAAFYGATGAAFGVGSIRKSVVSYATNNFAFTTQGLTAQTDAAGTVPTTNRIYFGASSLGNSQFINGTIRRIAYYPVRVTNAQLQALTG